MRNWRVRSLRQNLRPLRRLPDLLPWRKRAPSQLKSAPLPRRPRCRKSICPTNGRPFSKRRVLARELANLPPLCQQRLRLDPRVTRRPGTWKSFKLARNLRLPRRPTHRRSPRSMLPAQHVQFRSNRNASPEKRGRSMRRPSPNKYQRLEFRRNLLSQSSPNSNWNRSMNSCWKRSHWCPRRLASPVCSRRCSTSFGPNWVRWARKTKTSKRTTTWASRFVRWGSSRKPSASFRKSPKPAIAAIWYERALRTPGNDPESTLALRYDLGVAQESAGEPEAALKSFSQVYAMNIDYRDVAERIAALQKPIRRS